MIGFIPSHLAFLKNQTSILVLLRKLDHAQIKFKLSISMGIFTYAVYILYLYFRERVDIIMQFISYTTIYVWECQWLKSKTNIWWVIEKHVNLYINMVFIIGSAWSITYLYSFTDTDADGNVSRDSASSGSSWNRLTSSQSKFQTFKPFLPPSTFTLTTFKICTSRT